MSNWNDISTAPTDGTPVNLRLTLDTDPPETQEIRDAYFRDGKWWHVKQYEVPVTVMMVQERVNEIYGPWVTHWEPTHWKAPAEPMDAVEAERKPEDAVIEPKKERITKKHRVGREG